MDNRLEKAMTVLIYNNNYMADLIYQTHITFTKSMPTACVQIKNNKILMKINPDFWDTMTTLEQIAVLEHECYHLLNNHIPRFIEIFGNTSKQMSNANIAMDLAINQYISNLPAQCIDFDEFKKHLPDILPKETWEHYYAFFKDQIEKGNIKESEDGNGLFSSFDDHDWGDCDCSAETAKEVIKDAVNKAKDSHAQRGGRISGDMQTLIDTLNYVPKNWKSDIRMFVAKTQNIKIEQNRKVRNRRYGVIFPGEKKESVLHLALAVDTSGSISEEQLSQFGAEIDKVADFAQVTVIEADSEVKNVYLYKKGQKFSVSGRGGTAYQPALDKAKDLDVDGLIYFGDMDNFEEELIKPKYPVLWAIVGDQKPPATWGRQTKIEVRTK